MADINIALDPKPYKWRWVLTIPKPKHKNPNNTVVIRRGGVRPIQTEYIQRQKINANGLRSDPLLRQNLFQGFSTP